MRFHKPYPLRTRAGFPKSYRLIFLYWMAVTCMACSAPKLIPPDNKSVDELRSDYRYCKEEADKWASTKGGFSGFLNSTQNRNYYQVCMIGRGWTPD